MKKYYYIGVMVNDIKSNELKIVYKIDAVNKVACWGTYEEIREKGEKPLLFKTKTRAEEITKCLCMNFNLAIMITSFVELK